MKTKFGILAGLALTMFIGGIAVMLALGVISPSGVQGAYLPITDHGQGAGFQQGSTVTNVTVTNSPNEPGAVAQFTVKFVTGEVLQANVDTIVLDIDSSVGVPSSLSAEHVRIFASDISGPRLVTQVVAPPLDPSHEYGIEGRDIYTITVPDMDTYDDVTTNIDTGATVTVIILANAGLINPTESGSYDFTISTSRESMGVKATFMTPLTLSIDSKKGNRDTPITVLGKGFKKGTVATTYLDRSRDADGKIVNVPDGMRTPGTDVDLLYTYVASDDTFTETYNVTVPPFAVEGLNQINVTDSEDPPNHYNGMGGQTPVTFTIEPLLSVSSFPVAVGDELEITLVDWPATDQVMDHVTSDAQGVERVLQSAVTVAGIPQQIASGEGPVGPDNRHTFRVRIGTSVPTGVQQLKVKTYTSGQMMSDVPGGASDTKNIAVTDAIPPEDTPPDPNSIGADRAALIALFNATDGVNWTNTANWQTNMPLGRWFGVSVRGLPRRVSGLYLGRNRLAGAIPAQLGNLTNLTRLDLVGNQLRGTIPAEISHLSNLWYLNLSENRLSGAIPAGLARLTNLRDLLLYENQLNGGIPGELGNLTNLEYLDLTRNQLTGPIPSELGRLTNLNVLALGINQLTGQMPAELGSLTNLQALDLDGNQLTGGIPDELGSLTNLQAMNLSANQLSGEIPEELGDLTNLEMLVLDENQLSGEIPLELGSLSDLTLLSLRGNHLSGEIPKELGNLTNLKELYLDHNRLNGEIPAELGNLTNLESVYLSNNQLTGCVPAGLRRVANNDLDELGLPFCDMLRPDSIEGDRAALVALYNATDGANWANNSGWLTDTPMSQWHGVVTDKTGRVTRLVLEENRLSGEIPAELGRLSNLTAFYLGGNQLGGEIPVELGSLSDLTLLSFWGNHLTGEIPAELGGLSDLTLVELWGNQLSGEIPGELGGLSGLTLLYLHTNQLSGNIPAELSRLTNLIHLSLHTNQLSGEIPQELGGLSDLTGLYLGGNQLGGEIPQELGRLTNLGGLSLGHNRLSGEIPAELGRLTNLTALYLEGNQLGGEIPSELGSLTNLGKLALNANQLTGEIPVELGSLTSLTALYLRGNQLGGEIPVELGGLTMLVGLDLSDNQLTGMIPEELGNLTNLTDLELSPNRLTGCIPAGLRSAANSDLTDLGIPFCDMLNGSPVSVIRFRPADAPVRIDSSITLEATFSEPVSGFTLDDVSVANGAASSFSGSGAVYTFDVTPNAIGEVTVDIAASAAEDAEGKGNVEAHLPIGIPYDDDGNGTINRPEVIGAVDDYFEGLITREQVIGVIALYFSS